MPKRTPRQGMTCFYSMLFFVVAVLLLKHVCLGLFGYLSMLLMGMVIGDSLHRIMTPDAAQASDAEDSASQQTFWRLGSQATG